MRAVTVLFALLVGACSTPIVVDGYCERKAHELIDFRDRGLLGLNDHNKRAILVGDNTWKRDCSHLIAKEKK